MSAPGTKTRRTGADGQRIAAAVQTIRLPHAGSYDWTAALTFLGRRAIDGVEVVGTTVYQRTISADGVRATIAVEHDEHQRVLVVTITGTSTAADTVAARVRRMFDLDADASAIAEHLGRDPEMAPLIAHRIPLRVFRGWDGFEVAARSIIGQQVSVERARRLNGILVERAVEHRGGVSASDPLRSYFPTPQQVLDANLSNMGMPGARVAALKAIAEAAMAEPALFERAATLDETIGRLLAVRGIGPWTAHYIAMRACGEPDAFPASDVGLLRGAADASGRRPTPVQLLARAERWRPWRAYAAHYLWARDV